MHIAKTYMCDGLTDKAIQAILELSAKCELLIEDNMRKQKIIDELRAKLKEE